MLFFLDRLRLFLLLLFFLVILNLSVLQILVLNWRNIGLLFDVSHLVISGPTNL